MVFGSWYVSPLLAVTCEGSRQEPAVDVDLVRTEIDDRSAAQAFTERQLRNWCMSLKPLLEPIRRNRVPIGRPEVGCDPAVPLPVDRDDAAEQLRLTDQLVIAMQVARIRAPLVPDLKELAGLAATDHVPRSFERGRHLLLAARACPP